MELIETYLRTGLKTVHGWLNPFTARFLMNLSRIQSESGIRGGVGEIGVHMGKLFIVLHLSRDGGERSFVIDVFGDQHLNVDRSGFGNREIFLRNVARWAGQTDEIAIIQKSSLDVDPEEILGAVGPARLVSIDGGHTAECAESDLRLIEKVLDPRGVAVLDDCFNEAWPGVVTGLTSYLADSSTKLRPFAISPNKVYLAREEWHPLYNEGLLKKYERPFKRSQFMGFDVLIFRELPPLPAAKRLRRAVAASPVGPLIRKLRRRAKADVQGERVPGRP